MYPVSKHGFTLAELLVSVLILGVISTFTIPKVLYAQANGSSNAAAKEAAAAITQAYQLYVYANGSPATLTGDKLITYLNYVQRDTTSLIDEYPTLSTTNCAQAWARCMKMHSGGILLLDGPATYPAGTSNLDAISVDFDPDGKVSTQKSVGFILYRNGFLTTMGTAKTSTCLSWNCTMNAEPTWDPSWFKW